MKARHERSWRPLDGLDHEAKRITGLESAAP
jgi:hypothetical protein